MSVSKLFSCVLFFYFSLCFLQARSINGTIYPQVVITAPVIRLDGEVVYGEARASSKSTISLSAGLGEVVVLNFNYVLGRPMTHKDVSLGHLSSEQAKNINVGSFVDAPRGSLWIVSCYAEKNGTRGDTKVAIFTHL